MYLRIPYMRSAGQARGRFVFAVGRGEGVLLASGRFGEF
jgi:hypothetical protein